VSANLFRRAMSGATLALILVFGISAFGQTPKPKKVFIETDMEGVDGIFDFELQCIPWKSQRWDESRKLLADEVNAAVDGLLAGGATEVTVLDGHTGGSGMSLLDLHPKAKMITGLHSVPSTLGLDSSYSALVFIGRHAMSGADKGILAHEEGWDLRNMWVNGILVGEFGNRVFLAAGFGIPTIMVAGDTAACKEAGALVPGIECAEVKSGFNATSGIMLSHQMACDLIRQKAQRAMERLSEFKPQQLSQPVEMKIQLSHLLGSNYDRDLVSRGAERGPDWTFVFRGQTFLEVWKKFQGR
jgi:D-amino peptidase